MNSSINHFQYARKHALCGLSGIGYLIVSLSGCAPLATTPVALGCEQLANASVAANRIGLPTRGAQVTSVKLVPAGGTAPKNFGAYCLVAGAIKPMDPAAPDIKFNVALPESWNGRTLMLGGGGYDGSVPNVAGNIAAGPADQPNPVGRGYAVYGSDSGHEGPSNRGSFALNDEALRNFASDALKKTHDTAQALVSMRYAQKVQHAYFAGGSTGGREALTVAQKWPQDFDGVIALYPAFDAVSLDLQFGRITRALAEPGAYANLAKRQALYESAMQACDGADGVADRLISDVAGCHKRFDPATATLNGRPLRCAGGADTGDDCLSEAQIKALRVINSPIKFNYPMANGEDHYPGFNTWGTDFGRPGSGTQALVSFLGLNSVAPGNSMPQPPAAATPGIPYHSAFWDQWAKYFVTRNPDFDALTLDPESPGRWAARISELSGLQDVTKADYSAFERRGGKILMAHGSADQLVSTRATEEYFERIRSTMGAARTQAFLRYYEIPGYNHAASTTFNAAWDSLTALENWVERSQAPADQRVFDTVAVPGRSRPLCEYPAWPQYRGQGDVNASGSFVCKTTD
jgi:pimeloyl-ACP methyl ester carboxylesterase